MEGENYQIFAMGNGTNRLKDYATFITDYIDDNGFLNKDYATLITDYIDDNGFLNAVQRIEEEY